MIATPSKRSAPGAWFLLARGGNSTIRITPGLTLRENERSEIEVLKRHAPGGWLRFDIEADVLWVQVISPSWTLGTGKRLLGDRMRLDDSLELVLPHHTFQISGSLDQSTRERYPQVRLVRRRARPGVNVRTLPESRPRTGRWEVAPSEPPEPEPKWERPPGRDSGTKKEQGRSSSRAVAALQRDRGREAAPTGGAAPTRQGSPNRQASSTRQASPAKQAALATKTGPSKKGAPSKRAAVAKAALAGGAAAGSASERAAPARSASTLPDSTATGSGKGAAARGRQLPTSIQVPASSRAGRKGRRASRRRRASATSWADSVAILVFLAALGFAAPAWTPVTPSGSGQSRTPEQLVLASFGGDHQSLVDKVDALVAATPQDRATLEFAVEAYRLAEREMPDNAELSARLRELEARLLAAPAQVD